MLARESPKIVQITDRISALAKSADAAVGSIEPLVENADRAVEFRNVNTTVDAIRDPLVKDLAELQLTMAQARDLRWAPASTPPDAPLLELGINFYGLIERKLNHFHSDAPALGHPNHLHQFRARSPIGDANRTAVGSAAVVKVVVAPAQPDDRPCAVRAKHRGAEVESGLHPYTIQH